MPNVAKRAGAVSEGTLLKECREKKVLKTGGDDEKVVTNRAAVSVCFTTSVVELKLLQMFTTSYVNWQLSASRLRLLSLQQLLKSGRDDVVVGTVLLLFCHT